MGITTENPISTDPRLKELLTDIDDVKTKETYIVWRKSFLKIYESYLDPDGILNGIDSNYRLLKQLKVLNERIVRVNNLINDGKSIIIVGEGEEQHVNVTAEGRRGLTNLTDEVARTEKLIEEFMPKTNINEERVGYDKFELAAVLISDGFHGYDLMKETNTLLEQLISNNNNNNNNGNNKVLLAVDDNFQKIIKNYNNSIDSFINVMEDLGIFNIMKQCVHVVYDGNERPEPKPPPPPPADDESDNNTSSDDDIDQVKGKGKDRDTTVSNSDHDNDNGSNHDSKEKKKKKKEKTSKEKSLARVRARMENRKKGNGTRSKRNDVDNKGEDGGDSNNALKKPTDATKAISRIKNDNSNKTRAATHPIGDNDGDDEEANPSALLHQHPNEEEGKDEEEEEEDEEEEPPPEDGEGDDDCEFLIYFDPKTNSIGQINREECSAKSRLIVAADNNENKKASDNDNDEHDDEHKQVANGCYNNAKDEYQNIIEDDREKQEIIWLLKKLEKTKPVEVSWLDEIKKEKAAAKAKEEAAAGGGGGSGGGKKKDSGKKKKKRTTTKGISKRDSPAAAVASSSSSKEKKKKKSTVEDYQGKYRKEAAKPSAGGWN
ncbi:hypothetical protein FRACYDRAFT_241207 [Fragilariopsis cylindrus CCMP1102]|uniref:Uncharacterized protein n=1 Tax=Fragilariopsis cylindrus CCMP1102 TaxID=635003 RepID=A0A1E7F9G3_9STRA|nr:hypothetical protein FRACYDRAFT_241207 [Fragilariopsis cylindrus CCMP1102]|eukprot:OEU14655.1 hypothetical protein FRACYDRAFT_241207 [Fragilariopsis cylindrus CCMP1102]